MRPKQAREVGGRQAMWNLLRAGDETTTNELVRASRSTGGGVSSYMAALVRHGYVERSARGNFRLLKNTGKRAPSVNIAAGTLFDWNLTPPMEPGHLASIWQKSNLSLNAFGVVLGLSVGSGTRLKQMIDGSRPISPAVEARALAFDEATP